MGGLPAKSGLQPSKLALRRPLEPLAARRRGQREIRETPPRRVISVRRGGGGLVSLLAMSPETIGCCVVALAVLAMAGMTQRHGRALDRIADAMQANSTAFAWPLAELQHAVTALERAAEAMEKLAARIHPPAGPAA
jgi:hypothetical protein